MPAPVPAPAPLLAAGAVAVVEKNRGLMDAWASFRDANAYCEEWVKWDVGGVR